MSKNRFFIYLTVMASVLLLLTSVTALAASVPRMTTDELKSHLGAADYLVLDVRSGSDWSGSTEKVSGAERVEPRDVNGWADNYDKGKTIVLYCA